MMLINRIRQGLFCLAILSLAICLGTLKSNAQSTTQGSIAGTVEDPSGAVLPGATIAILNDATGFKVSLTADSNGFFKAPLLEPGTYNVTISASGFAGYKAQHVTVLVGQVTALQPHLALASNSAEVVVTDQAPVMNLESPDFSGTLNSVAMQNIPVNNRRWSALALTTPGVTVDASGYGLISVRGISTIMNNVEIDGADDNQAFFSEERGRTREAYSTAGNAVREFAVNTGVYSAQYGRAAGGVITSVTRSGTNEIHGQAYFYDKESNWNAFNNYTKVSSLVNGANVSTVIKPKDLRKIYGFTAGGALVKDKLFWIYTYDQHSHIFPVIGVPSNPLQFYTLPSATAAANCNTTTGKFTSNGSVNDAQACALAARQGISYVQAAYDWAAMVYGSSNVNVSNYTGANAISDIGLNSAIGQVSRFGYQEINTPKVDWQITPREHWSVLYHRLRWDSPGGVQTTASDSYSQDAQGNDFVKLDYGVTKLTSLISNSISNELLFQYGRELDYETQQAYTQYSKTNYMTGTNVPYVAAGSSYGFNSGSPYYSYRTAYPDERKWQIGDIVYWGKGSHSFKFGVDVVHNNDLMNSLGVYNGINTIAANGYYGYGYVGNLFNDTLNRRNGVTPSTSNLRGCDTVSAQNFTGIATGQTSVAGPYPCYSSFAQAFGNPVYQINTLDFGVFAQDNWKFSPRMTLELGIRWDHESWPGPDSNLTSATGVFVPYAGLNNDPKDNTDFGPRVGFSYDIFGSGKTVLRGGYGIYYGRILNGNIETVRLGTGSPNGQFARTWKPTWSASNAGGPSFPTVYSTVAMAACVANSASCPGSYYVSPNLKLPEVQEYDLQIQQDLGHGNYLSLSYLGGLGRRLPNFLNMNLNPSSLTTKTITIAGDPNGVGPLGATGATVSAPVYTAYGNTNLFGAASANFSNISQFISNVNSSYNGLVVELQNHSLKSLQFDANYTWSHSLDYAQGANTQGTTNSWYDPFGNYRANYGNSTWNIPQRFVGYVLYTIPSLHIDNFSKYLVNGWSINDSFQMQNGLPFTAGLSGSITNAISSGWNGAGGPSLIPNIGINTYRYPRRIVDDIRLQKTIPLDVSKCIKSIDLQLNAFNVVNHQNITGFSATYLYLMSGTTATYTGQNGTGNKSFMVVNNSNNSNFTYAPRNIEISARINF